MQEWRSLVEEDVKQYLHYLIEIDPLCFHRDRKMSISVERRGLPSQLLIQNLVRMSIKGYKLLFPLSVSPGLVDMTRNLTVVGLNHSTVNWLDIFHINLLQNGSLFERNRE